ncbi:MAG: DUF374 domain-containing protein, partial [Lentisphaeria bacterium]|nr:DUF374 domain-containing protein [Lentisphaeria bacterium]
MPCLDHAGYTVARRLFTLKGRRRLPALVCWLLATTLKILRRTYRVRASDAAGFLAEGGPWPVIVVLWHNRILFTGDCFPRRLRACSSVLISASRDGEYAARVVQHFGLGVVRGSSSRGGFRALRDLRRVLAEGHTVVVPVDGPRGPRYTPHPGAVALAAASGVPILPVALNA